MVILVQIYETGRTGNPESGDFGSSDKCLSSIGFQTLESLLLLDKTR